MTNRTLDQRILPLEPQYHERVWGGQRLRPSDPPIGEAWVAFERSVVTSGPASGQTLGELSESHGSAILGEAVARRYGARFPLLIKLLDCADWLSVQVHPNDEQAERLAGPGQFGKTEAWYFLDVAPAAQVLAGVEPSTTPETLARAIRDGRVLDVARRFEVHVGDTLFIPAGTVHALGPGLLLYEVQQSSDITYRVYDWDRPASAGRRLHLEESVAVADPRRSPRLTPAPDRRERGAVPVVACPYFQLEAIHVVDAPFDGDTRRESFHILTVVDGAIEVAREDERVSMSRHQSVVVAGSAGAYQIHSSKRATILRASVPAFAADRPVHEEP